MGASMSRYVFTSSSLSDFYHLRGGAGNYAIQSVENDSVSELDLSGCYQIGDSGTGALAAALPGNTQLTKLYMNKCNISDGGVMALSAMLQHTCIKVLYLEGNHIGDRGAITLSIAAAAATPLRDSENNIDNDDGVVFDRNYNYMNSEGLGEMIEAERNNNVAIDKSSSSTTKLQVLGLSSNNIGITGCKALANTLKNSKSLKRMTLRQNDIGNLGASAFGKALQTNTCLEFLDLTATKIGNIGAAALCDGLKTNNSLKTLLLGYNNIGDEGVQAFAALLQPTITTTTSSTTNDQNGLQCLDLRRNPWSEKSLHVLAHAIKDNYNLEELHMTGCDLPQNKEVHSSLKDIHYTLLLNRGGRRLLREQYTNKNNEEGGIPIGLWSFVLGRVTCLPDMIYYFVHSNPELFTRNNDDVHNSMCQ